MVLERLINNSDLSVVTIIWGEYMEETYKEATINPAEVEVVYYKGEQYFRVRYGNKEVIVSMDTVINEEEGKLILSIDASLGEESLLSSCKTEGITITKRLENKLRNI